MSVFGFQIRVCEFVWGVYSKLFANVIVTNIFISNKPQSRNICGAFAIVEKHGEMLDLIVRERKRTMNEYQQKVSLARDETERAKLKAMTETQVYEQWFQLDRLFNEMFEVELFHIHTMICNC